MGGGELSLCFVEGGGGTDDQLKSKLQIGEGGWLCRGL